MFRIMALDIGLKRTGIAITNIEQTIALPLKTMPTINVIGFIVEYDKKNPIEKIIIGWPLDLTGNKMPFSQFILDLSSKLQVRLNKIKIEMFDERFTSKMASYSIRQMGLKKKDRQDKSLIDITAATIILQDYLKAKEYINDITH